MIIFPYPFTSAQLKRLLSAEFFLWTFLKRNWDRAPRYDALRFQIG
jgi:hypothetical protein